jgi:hypothetical protein
MWSEVGMIRYSFRIFCHPKKCINPWLFEASDDYKRKIFVAVILIKYQMGTSAYLQSDNTTHPATAQNYPTNPKIRYHFHKSQSLDAVLSHMTPINNLITCFFRFHFNIILPSTPMPPSGLFELLSYKAFIFLLGGWLRRCFHSLSKFKFSPCCYA